MTLVTLKDIRARYGNIEVLKGVSLQLEPSELVCVLGPSGCGKTTLLRVIAGFADYTGTLLIDDRDIARVPPHRRDIGIVFQDYALFPHQTVAENIGYGLRMRSRPTAQVSRRVDELIALLKLDTLAARYPSDLSGGQRQRVAVARALAIEPKMLLLDEPLSALDKKLREEMQVELRQIQKTVGITTMFVTHDQEEALALADKVVVMKDGHIRQIGTPIEVYLHPVDEFVADFIGKSSFFEADVVERSGDTITSRLASGETVRIPGALVASGRKRVVFSVRPERVRISRASTQTQDANVLEGVIEHVTFLGPYQQIRAIAGGNRRIDVHASNETVWRQGDSVTLEWHPKDAIVMREAEQ
jgi:putative spermidine/putrescine transport system ATP-binding protein